jgi:hypothetical protein
MYEVFDTRNLQYFIGDTTKMQYLNILVYINYVTSKLSCLMALILQKVAGSRCAFFLHH